MNFPPTKQNKTKPTSSCDILASPLPPQEILKKKLQWFQARQKSEAECDSLLDSDFHFDGSLVEFDSSLVSVDVFSAGKPSDW